MIFLVLLHANIYVNNFLKTMNNNLEQLRELMRSKGVEAVIIPGTLKVVALNCRMWNIAVTWR